MSDFLTNLVGRSLGTLAVVKPRIPSIYEPYRRGSGLLGVRQGADARESDPGSAVEIGPEGEPNTPSISHRNSNLPQQASRSAALEGQFPPTQTPIPVADALAEALAGQSARARREATAEPARMPTPTAANSDGTVDQALARPGGTLQTARPTGSERGGTAGSTRSVADSPRGSHRGPVHPLPVPDTNPMRMDHPQPPPRLTGNSDEKNPARPRFDRPPAAPALALQQSSSIPSALRPPLASRSAERSHPTALPASAPAQSSIQVSIGRVEVRAVFPEPVARPSPGPRSRPTVSLDEYLKQSSRGKR